MLGVADRVDKGSTLSCTQNSKEQHHAGLPETKFQNWRQIFKNMRNHPLLEILTIVCLTFYLLLTDRPILGLPEYKLKFVNICKMHGTWWLEVVVL